MRALVGLLFCAMVFVGFVARADETNSSPATAATLVYDPSALPSGDVGASIRYGREIVTNTQVVMKGYVRAKLDCAACHIAGGTQAKGGSFVGTYAYFPQWNKRAHRVIALQDRLAECFLYSMNGRPPAYASKEMVALVAYIAWLSRGTPVFSTPAPAKGFIEPLPSASPNVTHGSAVYTQQ